METATAVATVATIVPASNATTANEITATNAINVNQSDSNSHTHINSGGTSATSSSNSNINNSNSNSSSSSCSTSSNSSGYGSTTTTPTNNYETHQQQHTPTPTRTPTTPVAIAEPVIPIATVAAVTPYYNEAITTHNLEIQHQQQQYHHHQQQQQQQQQQHHLQQSFQHHQYLQRQQYYAPYDYSQQTPSNLSSPAAYNLSSVVPYDISSPNTSAAATYGGSQYKSSSLSAINYERNTSVRPTTTSSNIYTHQVQKEQQSKTVQNLQLQQQQFVKQRTSGSLITSSNTTGSKPQAAATPFYAQPLSQHSNPATFYDNLKHKIPLEYHDSYTNPNSATYHQQQKYYAAAKSQLKEATYGSPVLGSKTLYPSTTNFYSGATVNHGYDKYMYPNATGNAYPTTGHLPNEPPPDTSYRKTAVANNLSSPTWPWGIEYASGNSRTIPPPPVTHLPTATVAPTHATYLTPNPSVLSRDPYYMHHDKFNAKYDKYSASACPPAYQQTYVSPPATRHHMWPSSHGPQLTQLNDRHHLATGPTVPPPHALHSSPYFPNNSETSMNTRQTCYSQPYQPQSCYYPTPNRLPLNQAQPPIGQTAAYMTGQQPNGQSITSSCKYGGVMADNGTKLKSPNDLYVTSHYDTNNTPLNYGYGSNQIYNTNAHQSLNHGPSPALTHEPLAVNPASYTNDLNLTSSNFENYPAHHHDSHLATPMHSQQQPPQYAPTVAKRALLDYRKPIQPQPPPIVQEECYTTLTTAAARDQYNHQELLNAPESTSAFVEYDVNQEVASITYNASSETIRETEKANEEENKNLSLRDFIANWNDDEDEYNNTEELSFEQSSNVINEVLQVTPIEPEIQATEMEQPQALEIFKSVSLKEVTKPMDSSFTADSLNEVDSSQYVNLPDIIIDIEKSNNATVASSLSTPTAISVEEDNNASSLLNNFDVEKELDQLEMQKHGEKLEGNKDFNGIKENCITTPQLSPSKGITTQLNFDDLNLEQPTTTVPASITTRPMTSQSNNTDATTEQYLKDMEGYDSGNSRHSNESAFEKEYETFINKITSESTTKSTSDTVKISLDSELDFEQNVQDFSKFYKRKRKLKEDELKSLSVVNQNIKKIKSNSVENVNSSNFPQVYTKKSRNRQLKTVQNMPRKRKPLSVFYKIIHSLRNYRLFRIKRVRDYISELKEKHLPLIKRQSIKNYSHSGQENTYNPNSLKTLSVLAINSEEFRQRIMLDIEGSKDNSLACEEKHICTDPTCETCEVIKSLMEPESFENAIHNQEFVDDENCITTASLLVTEDVEHIVITKELALSQSSNENYLETEMVVRVNSPSLLQVLVTENSAHISNTPQEECLLVLEKYEQLKDDMGTNLNLTQAPLSETSNNSETNYVETKTEYLNSPTPLLSPQKNNSDVMEKDLIENENHTDLEVVQAPLAETSNNSLNSSVETQPEYLNSQTPLLSPQKNLSGVSENDLMESENHTNVEVVSEKIDSQSQPDETIENSYRNPISDLNINDTSTHSLETPINLKMDKKYSEELKEDICESKVLEESSKPSNIQSETINNNELLQTTSTCLNSIENNKAHENFIESDIKTNVEICDKSMLKIEEFVPSSAEMSSNSTQNISEEIHLKSQSKDDNNEDLITQPNLIEPIKYVQEEKDDSEDSASSDSDSGSSSDSSDDSSDDSKESRQINSEKGSSSDSDSETESESEDENSLNNNLNSATVCENVIDATKESITENSQKSPMQLNNITDKETEEDNIKPISENSSQISIKDSIEPLEFKNDSDSEWDDESDEEIIESISENETPASCNSSEKLIEELQELHSIKSDKDSRNLQLGKEDTRLSENNSEPIVEKRVEPIKIKIKLTTQVVDNCLNLNESDTESNYDYESETDDDDIDMECTKNDSSQVLRASQTLLQNTLELLHTSENSLDMSNISEENQKIPLDFFKSAKITEESKSDSESSQRKSNISQGNQETHLEFFKSLKDPEQSTPDSIVISDDESNEMPENIAELSMKNLKSHQHSEEKTDSTLISDECMENADNEDEVEVLLKRTEYSKRYTKISEQTCEELKSDTETDCNEICNTMTTENISSNINKVGIKSHFFKELRSINDEISKKDLSAIGEIKQNDKKDDENIISDSSCESSLCKSENIPEDFPQHREAPETLTQETSSETSIRSLELTRVESLTESFEFHKDEKEKTKDTISSPVTCCLDDAELGDCNTNEIAKEAASSEENIIECNFTSESDNSHLSTSNIKPSESSEVSETRSHYVQNVIIRYDNETSNTETSDDINRNTTTKDCADNARVKNPFNQVETEYSETISTLSQCSENIVKLVETTIKFNENPEEELKQLDKEENSHRYLDETTDTTNKFYDDSEEELEQDEEVESNTYSEETTETTNKFNDETEKELKQNEFIKEVNSHRCSEERTETTNKFNDKPEEELNQPDKEETAEITNNFNNEEELEQDEFVKEVNSHRCSEETTETINTFNNISEEELKLLDKEGNSHRYSDETIETKNKFNDKSEEKLEQDNFVVEVNSHRCSKETTETTNNFNDESEEELEQDNFTKEVNSHRYSEETTETTNKFNDKPEEELNQPDKEETAEITNNFNNEPVDKLEQDNFVMEVNSHRYSEETAEITNKFNDESEGELEQDKFVKESNSHRHSEETTETTNKFNENPEEKWNQNDKEEKTETSNNFSNEPADELNQDKFDKEVNSNKHSEEISETTNEFYEETEEELKQDNFDKEVKSRSYIEETTETTNNFNDELEEESKQHDKQEATETTNEFNDESEEELIQDMFEKEVNFHRHSNELPKSTSKFNKESEDELKQLPKEVNTHRLSEETTENTNKFTEEPEEKLEQLEKELNSHRYSEELTETTNKFNAEPEEELKQDKFSKEVNSHRLSEKSFNEEPEEELKELEKEVNSHIYSEEPTETASKFIDESVEEFTQLNKVVDSQSSSEETTNKFNEESEEELNSFNEEPEEEFKELEKEVNSHIYSEETTESANKFNEEPEEEFKQLEKEVDSQCYSEGTTETTNKFNDESEEELKQDKLGNEVNSNRYLDSPNNTNDAVMETADMKTVENFETTYIDQTSNAECLEDHENESYVDDQSEDISENTLKPDLQKEQSIDTEFTAKCILADFASLEKQIVAESTSDISDNMIHKPRTPSHEVEHSVKISGSENEKTELSKTSEIEDSEITEYRISETTEDVTNLDDPNTEPLKQSNPNEIIPNQIISESSLEKSMLDKTVTEPTIKDSAENELDIFEEMDDELKQNDDISENTINKNDNLEPNAYESFSETMNRNIEIETINDNVDNLEDIVPKSTKTIETTAEESNQNNVILEPPNNEYKIESNNALLVLASEQETSKIKRVLNKTCSGSNIDDQILSKPSETISNQIISKSSLEKSMLDKTVTEPIITDSAEKEFDETWVSTKYDNISESLAEEETKDKKYSETHIEIHDTVSKSTNQTLVNLTEDSEINDVITDNRTSEIVNEESKLHDTISESTTEDIIMDSKESEETARNIAYSNNITNSEGTKEDTITDKESTTEDFSGDFFGFKNQSSFEDESGDFHGFEDIEEERRIRREIENLNEDSAANDGFLNSTLNKESHTSSKTSLAESTTSEMNELEALEKELSQNRIDERHHDEDEIETDTNLINSTNEIISTNDIEHIKKMLESDEEPQQDETEYEATEISELPNTSREILKSKCSVIPKLSDLCKAALNSSLHLNNITIVQNVPGQTHNDDRPTTLVERELTVEEALAEMYRQAGVLLSDPEDCDNDTHKTTTYYNEEAQDVLLINLQEILNSDSDVYVLQCDMNDNDENDDENEASLEENTERVNTLQFIGILDTENSETQIHIISSDSESEVIILSDDDGETGFEPIATERHERITIPFINDSEFNDDSLSDISTIHHEEIVPENLNKFLQEEFYKYLHEKYVQRNISKYFYANRVLKKYKNRIVKKSRQ